MTPDRWKQISRIYEDARLRVPGDRVAFLAEACAGDPSLQRDVQALLDQPTSPEGLEGLTPSAIAEAIGNADGGGLTGRWFGVYLVGELIGGQLLDLAGRAPRRLRRAWWRGRRRHLDRRRRSTDVSTPNRARSGTRRVLRRSG
jgi:hypothetical protein